MKIIKRAIEAWKWRHKLTCHNCKTEIEASITDITYDGEKGNWHESGWQNYTVGCPECYTKLNIDPDDIHNLIKTKIKNRIKWFWQ